MNPPPNNLEEILENYRSQSFTEGWFEKDLDEWNAKHEEVHQIELAKAKQELEALLASQVAAALIKLKEDMRMHTVPEGQRLITRSYLNNSIDFMVAQLKEDSHEQ